MRGADPLTRLAIAIGIFAASFALVPERARADGALPNSQSILTPADRPQEVLLVTNFGVVLTEDGAKTWTWTCEQTANGLGYQYQLSPPPRHRVFALANQQLAYSDDGTCGWSVAGGTLAGQDIADAFVDRAVPDRVLAVGVKCCTAGSMIYSVFPSADAGSTFAAPLFTAAPGDSITGLESSVSDSKIIYLTMAVGPTFLPTLVRSSDGGATWQMKDLSGTLPKGGVRLFAVDPTDAQRVFLLWADPNLGQSVAVTTDGGATVKVTLPGDGSTLTGFLRTSTGSILVSSTLNTVPSLRRSRDGGMTFETIASPPHVLGLSARGGVVYAATDEFGGDGFAMATSSDEGTTWAPFMTYSDVRAIAACLKASCQDTCQMEAQMGVWSADVCSADAPPAVGDAGVGSPDARDGAAGNTTGPDAGGGGRGGSGGPGGSRGSGGGGGGCVVAPMGAGGVGRATVLAVAVSLVLLVRSRRRRR